uniref:Transmembrane protein n=1 Tax=Opuntia streptacantha TaxID=393608 RepID=A0A7C8YI68_OPUST
MKCPLSFKVEGSIPNMRAMVPRSNFWSSHAIICAIFDADGQYSFILLPLLSAFSSISLFLSVNFCVLRVIFFGVFAGKFWGFVCVTWRRKEMKKGGLRRGKVESLLVRSLTAFWKGRNKCRSASCEDFYMLRLQWAD